MKRSGANKKVIRRDPRANSGAVGNATIQNNGHQQHIFGSKKSLGNQQSAINANVNQEHNNYRNQRTSKTTNYSDQANPFQAASRSSDLQGAPFLPIDPQTKDTWFYPTNYPVRQYRRNCIISKYSCMPPNWAWKNIHRRSSDVQLLSLVSWWKNYIHGPNKALGGTASRSVPSNNVSTAERDSTTRWIY